MEENDPELWQTSCFNDFWLPGPSFVQPLAKLVNDAIVIPIIFCDGKLAFFAPCSGSVLYITHDGLALVPMLVETTCPSSL